MRMWPPEAEHFLGHYEDLALIDPQLSKRRVPVGADSFGSFCGEPQPLGRIYLLDRLRPQQAARVGITPLSPRDAVLELLRYSFMPRLVEAIGLQGRRLQLLTRAAQDVPMRRLSFPSGYRYLPDVCEAILADLRAG
jgi:hypothetical protein